MTTSLGTYLGTRLGTELGTGSDDGVATYQTILGGLLVEMWDARVGVSAPGNVVASWTGSNGRVLTPPGTGPAYAADGANFKGLPVVQCAQTGPKRLSALAQPIILASGSKPWTFSVFRFRVAQTGLNAGLLDLGSASLTHHYLTWRASNDSLHLQTNNGANGDTSSIVPFDTVAHSVQAWVDTVNNLTVDSTAYTSAGSTGVSLNVTAIGVGCLSFAGNIQASDSSHALHILCSAKPSAGQIAAVKARAFSDWGV